MNWNVSGIPCKSKSDFSLPLWLRTHLSWNFLLAIRAGWHWGSETAFIALFCIIESVSYFLSFSSICSLSFSKSMTLSWVSFKSPSSLRLALSRSILTFFSCSSEPSSFRNKVTYEGYWTQQFTTVRCMLSRVLCWAIASCKAEVLQYKHSNQHFLFSSSQWVYGLWKCNIRVIHALHLCKHYSSLTSKVLFDSMLVTLLMQTERISPCYCTPFRGWATQIMPYSISVTIPFTDSTWTAFLNRLFLKGQEYRSKICNIPGSWKLLRVDKQPWENMEVEPTYIIHLLFQFHFSFA